MVRSVVLALPDSLLCPTLPPECEEDQRCGELTSEEAVKFVGSRPCFWMSRHQVGGLLIRFLRGESDRSFDSIHAIAGVPTGQASRRQLVRHVHEVFFSAAIDWATYLHQRHQHAVSASPSCLHQQSVIGLPSYLHQQSVVGLPASISSQYQWLGSPSPSMPSAVIACPSYLHQKSVIELHFLYNQYSLIAMIISLKRNHNTHILWRRVEAEAHDART